ncbi:MAG TPA: molecular chaperone DnaJ [Longimicrobiaceae bacterium]|nr:molecular chaperone DnaJ [Longimicrobiaceae bacterium]
MRDYYEILGVERGVDAEGIKKAYRKLALEHHPDRNGGDAGSEEKFKEATEAYEVLRDPEKRAAYDRFGHAGVKNGGGGGYAGFSGFGFEDALNIFMRDFGGFGGIDDLFGGGGRRGGRVQRGQDMRIRLRISLEEVATGIRKTIRLPILESCGKCSGTGSKSGAEPPVCPSCKGAGEIRRVQRSVFGQFMSAAPCPTCGGEGRRIEDPCDRCHGEGRERKESEFSVDVPPGVATDNYITLRSHGSIGLRGGPRGDILVILEVEDDLRFVRDGDDLIHMAQLSFSQAALGAEVEVPTVWGPERVDVPAGMQSGGVLTLRGKGLPSLGRGSRGDQHVRFQVWTPTRLTSEQETLFQQLAEIEGAPPEDDDDRSKHGFWHRMREAFSA